MLVTAIFLSLLVTSGGCLLDFFDFFIPKIDKYLLIGALNLLKLYCLCAAGFSVTVLQSADQISTPGAEETLECSVAEGYSMSSYTMLWYRQNHHGEQIQLLLTEYDKTAGRYQSSIEATINKFSLHISELHANDSSTYYCAASHSDACRPNTRTNTKLLGTQRQEEAVACLMVNLSAVS